MIRIGEDTMSSELNLNEIDVLLYDDFVTLLSTIIIEIIEDDKTTITDDLIA
jgi:hypothetical protein